MKLGFFSNAEVKYVIGDDESKILPKDSIKTQIHFTEDLIEKDDSGEVIVAMKEEFVPDFSKDSRFTDKSGYGYASGNQEYVEEVKNTTKRSVLKFLDDAIKSKLTDYETAESTLRKDEDVASYELEVFGFNDESELSTALDQIDGLVNDLSDLFDNIKHYVISPFKGRTLYGYKLVIIIF